MLQAKALGSCLVPLIWACAAICISFNVFDGDETSADDEEEADEEADEEDDEEAVELEGEGRGSGMGSPVAME